MGKMGLRDQNNGKKIGINGSRIYHVTTLIIGRREKWPEKVERREKMKCWE